MIAILLAVIAVGAGGFWFYNNNNDDTTDQNTTETTQQAPVEQTAQITFSEDQKTVSHEGQTGKTALEVLESLTTVTTEESSFGLFVTGINGVQADSTKNYWAFYVNGAYASEGAGTYKTTDGEKIEWKLEDIQL